MPLRTVQVPDIGDFEDVEVIEVLVSPGDRVEVEDSLVTLESDKASMEIPSPVAGTVGELLVAVGDRVSEGAPLARVEVATAGEEEKEEGEEKAPEPASETAAPGAAGRAPQPNAEGGSRDEDTREATVGAGAGGEAAPPREDAPGEARPGAIGAYWDDAREEAPPVAAHASPSVRRLARELGVDLGLVQGSGRKGRVRKGDVEAYVKSALAQGTAAGVPIAGVSVMRPREIDFEKFGPTELEPLHRIRRLSSANLHRSWVTVPHVTQFEDADVTDLESFRQEQKPAAEARGVKLTFLPFVVKAVSAALLELPHFNASLDHTGENLILKRYVHIGVAVDTQHGLVVPVLRDADRKGILQLAEELQDLSGRARERKLRPDDMQGGTFSISSLGGIGGTKFTPIVNHPEVAILGVSRMDWRPVWRDGAFVPRRILPLSLSYDHRVIDGADAARFTTRLASLLADLRLLVL